MDDVHGENWRQLKLHLWSCLSVREKSGKDKLCAFVKRKRIHETLGQIGHWPRKYSARLQSHSFATNIS